MRISYAPEVDALYIRLIEGTHQCHNVRVTDDISLNIGEGEVLVGIEILDARETLGNGLAPTVVLENIPVVQS